MQSIRQWSNMLLSFAHRAAQWSTPSTVVRHTSSSQPSEFISSNLENGAGRYVCQLQRITFKFCKESAGSSGLREFIEKDLIEFATKHPGIVIYLQPKRHHKPKMCAEYLNGSRQTMDVHQYSRDKLSKWLEFLRTRKGGVIVRLLKKQQTHNPSIQGVWNPFSNKLPALAVESFPSAKLAAPLDAPKTATEQVLELAAAQAAINESRRRARRVTA